MSKIRLIFKSVTGIVDSGDVGLFIPVGEQQQRQLAIPCGHSTLNQFSLRIQKAPVTNIILPEVLWQVIRSQTTLCSKALINDPIEGQYGVALYSVEAPGPILIRIGDVMLLVYVSNAPAYIYKKLMKKQSVKYVHNTRGVPIPVNTLTDEMLRKASNKAIEGEHYELVSLLRDEMKRRNSLDIRCLNMKEVRYFYIPSATQATELPLEETRRAVSVLRLKTGDEVSLIDGEGSFYQANIILAATKYYMYDVVRALPQQKTWKEHVYLAIAPTKMMDRMEWMVEKVTEVGFDEITFLDHRFSERKKLRIDHLEKIVVAAMKQGRKAWKPVIYPVMSFQDSVNQQREGGLYIIHCYIKIARKDFPSEIQQANDQQDITMLVGPEGDLSMDEVKQALEKELLSVSLGQNRLRTETVGLVSVMIPQVIERVLQSMIEKAENI